MRTSKSMTLDAAGRPRRAEVWEAWHAGFHLERIEQPGTPWSLTLLETGEWAGTWPSRQKAMQAINCGEAMRAIDIRRVEALTRWMAWATCPAP